jgi:organic hydroperoxide reductase OsmC/OhrA
MAEDNVHEVHVSLTRERPPIRKAVLQMTGDEVTFGTPGWQGEHYGFAPEVVEGHPPGTLDYLVASVAGCLIGTFGGALRARGIESAGDALTADAVGEVVVDDDDVLRLRKIVVRYTLRAPESQRAAAERANEHHARHCPNARSVAAAIEIVTELDFVPQPEPAPAGV